MSSDGADLEEEVMRRIEASQRIAVPPPLISIKGKVATEPFAVTAIETKKVGTGAVGVGRIDNQDSFVELKVVAPSEDGRFKVGQSVLVAGTLFAQPWAKKVQTLRSTGTKYILVPDSLVEAILNG